MHIAIHRVPNQQKQHGAALTTAYREVPARRQNANPPLLLVHGYTGSSLDFHNQLPWFAEHRRVIAPDQRGHGDSTNSAPYTLRQLRDDLLGFMDALGLEHCDLLGHSMGGMVALHTVLKDVQRFRSLILMDTSAQPIATMKKNIADQLANTVTQQGCAALVSMMRGVPLSSPVKRAIEFLGEAEHWRRIQLKLEQMDPEAFVAIGQAMRNHQISDEQLAQITCPTTVVVGADDKPFRKPSQHLAQTIPHAKLSVIADAAHSPQYENSEHWQHAIDNHLAELG